VVNALGLSWSADASVMVGSTNIDGSGAPPTSGVDCSTLVTRLVS
jgi:hypothetical protein